MNFTLFTRLCLSRLIEVTHESSSGNKWNLQNPQLIVRCHVNLKFALCAHMLLNKNRNKNRWCVPYSHHIIVTQGPYWLLCHAKGSFAVVRFHGRNKSHFNIWDSYPFSNFLEETHQRLTIYAIQGCLKFKFSKIFLQLIVIKTPPKQWYPNKSQLQNLSKCRNK